jgi:hypothetical protein
MAAEAAAMLDELMGKYRNAAPHEVAEQHWSDEEVCIGNAIKDLRSSVDLGNFIYLVRLYSSYVS